MYNKIEYITNQLENDLKKHKTEISNEMKKNIIVSIYKHLKDIMIIDLIIDNIYHISNEVKFSYKTFNFSYNTDYITKIIKY